MNTLNFANHFAFQDGFTPVKILAGERIFDILAPQRTSIIFGITDEPWAAAAYRINNLIVQLEPHLNDWDLITISASGETRLVRHNSVIYDLQCSIPPDTTELHSNFFYRCPECNRHIYECAHLLISGQDQRQSIDPNRHSTKQEHTVCPRCGGKIQNLAPGVSFCLDCEWECGLEPLNYA